MMISPLFFFPNRKVSSDGNISGTTPTQVPNTHAISVGPLERPPSMIIYPEERTRESHDLTIGYKNT